MSGPARPLASTLPPAEGVGSGGQQGLQQDWKRHR
jgi:hypothetical protein